MLPQYELQYWFNGRTFVDYNNKIQVLPLYFGKFGRPFVAEQNLKNIIFTFKAFKSQKKIFKCNGLIT